MTHVPHILNAETSNRANSSQMLVDPNRSGQLRVVATIMTEGLDWLHQGHSAWPRSPKMR